MQPRHVINAFLIADKREEKKTMQIKLENNNIKAKKTKADERFRESPRQEIEITTNAFDDYPARLTTHQRSYVWAGDGH